MLSTLKAELMKVRFAFYALAFGLTVTVHLDRPIARFALSPLKAASAETKLIRHLGLDLTKVAKSRVSWTPEIRVKTRG